MRYLIAAAVLTLSGAAIAETWTVDDDGPADFDNIQAAVDAASDGDEIVVEAGTYTGTGEDVVRIIAKDIWLHSTKGPDATIIDGESTRRVMLCMSSSTIEGFTITRGYHAAGSGGGGGISIGFGSPVIQDCFIADNHAVQGGGAYAFNSGLPVLNDTDFCGNTPDAIAGKWTDAGNNCLANYCSDSDKDGLLDECDDIVGDGIHEVPGEFEHIDMAVAIANSGDTVLIAPGTYTYAGVGEAVVNLNGAAITLMGSGEPEETIIDGEGERYGILCNSGETTDTVIQNLSVVRGLNGIYVDSTSGPTIRNCYVSESFGIGIVGWVGSSLHIDSCNIFDNQCGGVLAYQADAEITGCLITGNSDACVGSGGITCYKGNYAHIHIEDTIVAGNQGRTAGGVEISTGWQGISYINNCQFLNNTASQGGPGAAYISSGYLTLSNSVFTQNTSTNTGGYDEDTLHIASGSCSITNCQFSDNTNAVENGAALHINTGGATCAITGCSVTSNVGGSINTYASSIEIHDCQLIGNNYGLRLSGSQLWMTDCIVEDNVGIVGNHHGGIYSEDTFCGRMSNCSIQRNISQQDGGGIWLSPGPSGVAGVNDYVIENCTIKDNEGNLGGGVYAEWWGGSGGGGTDSPALWILDSIISGNHAIDGAGLYLYGCNSPIVNCVIRNNIASTQGGGISSPYEDKWSTPEPWLHETTVCGNTPDQISGEWLDIWGNTIAETCNDCPDINQDGHVDIKDLLLLIKYWETNSQDADINNDGIVDTNDLLELLSGWGECQ